MGPASSGGVLKPSRLRTKGCPVMPISVFWRVSLGYLLILFVSVAVSSYSITELGHLGNVARTGINTDNQMIAYQEQLTDVFLSEVRYSGRFLITRAGALHDELQQFKAEFARYMTDIQSLAVSAELEARLSRIDELHARYHRLFDQEVRYIKTNQPYAESRYQREREKVFETALEEMERLRSQLQKNLHDKLESIERAAHTARTVAIVTMLFLIGSGIVLSYFISHSITWRLSQLRRRALLSGGDDPSFSHGFSQIPEIEDLANALSNAKRTLDETAKRNAALVHSMTEQFEIPLVALRNRLQYFAQELAPGVTAQQKASLDTLAGETDRLIRLYAELCARAADKVEPNRYETATVFDKTKQSRAWHYDDLLAYWNKLLARMKRAMRRCAEYGSGLMAVSWNTILKMPDQGKAKNNE